MFSQNSTSIFDTSHRTLLFGHRLLQLKFVQIASPQQLYSFLGAQQSDKIHVAMKFIIYALLQLKKRRKGRDRTHF